MELKTILVDEIEPSPFQPRKSFEKETLQDLANSIRKIGTLQPILVRKSGNGYQIVAGERRWRAAQMAGLKQIPAIIRATPEEDVIVESLIENLHRMNLTDIERENAIYRLWKSEGFKTKSELARALGLRESIVSDDIEAWEFRHRNEEISPSVPTYIVARTSFLKEEERKKIIKKFQEGEFRAIDVYSTVKIVKKASELLKEELFKPKSPITPKIAEILVEKLLDASEQAEIIQEVKRHKLTEEEVWDLVENTKSNTEDTRNISSQIVGEIYTGYIFTCPVCKRTYRVYHNRPTQAHTFREMR